MHDVMLRVLGHSTHEAWSRTTPGPHGSTPFGPRGTASGPSRPAAIGSWRVAPLAFVLTLLLLPSASPAQSSSPDSARQPPSNAEIALAVESKLRVDDGVAAHLIDVESVDGVITLSGSVDNLLAKARAAELAMTVRGVRSVIDQVAVRPVHRRDAEIEEGVERAFLQDPATVSYEVEVEVREGVATLSGTVESWTEKELAAVVARGVEGLKQVINRIEIRERNDRSDREIREEVKRRLAHDTWIDDAGIDVSVNDGVVTLFGSTGSVAERTRVRARAWVLGVDDVDDSALDVRPWADPNLDREVSFPDLADGEIRSAIKQTFAYDPRVAAFRLSVAVNHDVVTLTGRVDNLAAKHAAVSDARNTVGVWRVRDFIRVRPEVVFTDAELREAVEVALELNPYLRRYEFDISVRNGLVYLNGRVTNEFEREEAFRVAARVQGVVEVANHIQISRERVFESDWEVEANIVDALRWSPYVPEGRVHVEVANGIARLTGAVSDWAQRREAERLAREHGASGIKNRIRVDRGSGPSSSR